MVKWRYCREKRIIREFREVEYKDTKLIDGVEHYGEIMKRREGFEDTRFADVEKDFIFRGTDGSIFPIRKEYFFKHFDVLETPLEVYVKMKEAEK